MPGGQAAAHEHGHRPQWRRPGRSCTPV
jgi:hypothetical protein